MNIALIAPTFNAVSETFIDAHFKMLNGNVYYLYGGFLPSHFKNKNETGTLNKYSQIKRLLPAFLHDRIKRNNKGFLKFLLNRKIDVVLAEFGPTGVSVLPFCQTARVPLVVIFHGYDASVKAILETNELHYRNLFTYSSFIIAVSKHIQRKLEELGASPLKTAYTPCGPRKEFFNLRPNYKNGYFLSVGRFVEKKGPFLTLLAFFELSKKVGNVELVMVGDGPLLGACKQLAGALGLFNVKFLGALNHEEVLEVFEGAFCFIQHSITALNGDMEGTPVAILEAGATGLPTIATKHGGIPEVVVEASTGYLVNEGDIDSMAMRMEQIFKDETLRRMMGSNAREHILKNFTIEKHIDAINILLQRSLEATPYSKVEK